MTASVSCYQKFEVYTYRNAADVIAGGKLEGVVSDKLVVAQQQGCCARELGEKQGVTGS
jgi:hypothetical protein